jgi:ubiquinone/menaquinone biosynthesis C-methylase UbiE
MSGINYDDTDLPLRYDCARALSTKVLSQWLDAINTIIGSDVISTVMDVGCGTGRFTLGLRERFSAKVIGIDPSHRMLLQAPTCHDVHYIRGNAEEIPVADDCIDLVFMSMVWHHIQYKCIAGMEIARVLRLGGFFCIRTSTLNTLDSYLYLRFFPEARRINECTLPSRAQLIEWASGCGLKLLQHTSVRQEVNKCLNDYADRIARRGLSDLDAMSDEAFSTGLRKLRQYCHCHDRGEPVTEEIDLFVFQK